MIVPRYNLHGSRLGILFVAAGLSGCSNQPSIPTQPDRSVAAADHSLEHTIEVLIDAVYPGPRSLQQAAQAQWSSIRKSCAREGKTAECQAKTMNLIAFGTDHLVGGQLNEAPTCSGGCPTFVPATTAAALSALHLALLEFAGFQVTAPETDVPPEDVAVQVCAPDQPCSVVPESETFGSTLPSGACSVPCVVVGQKIDETAFDPGDGPLLLAHRQHPVFVQWDVLEAGTNAAAHGSFPVPVEIATCVPLTGPYAPADPGALRLAHPDPDDPAAIEFLPLAAAEGIEIECDGLKLGGRTTSFSPVVPTDTLPAPTATSGSISGTVTDAATGLPLEGKPMILYSITGSIVPASHAGTRTSVDGSFEFQDLPFGDYSVIASVYLSGGRNSDATISVDQPDAVLDFSLSSGYVADDTLHVGAQPAHLALDESLQRLYVYNTGYFNFEPREFCSLSVIDAGSHAEITRIRLDKASPPGQGDCDQGGLAVNPETHRVYVSVRRVGIYVIDGLTNQIVDTLPGIASRLKINPATNRLYRGGTFSGIEVIDLATGAILDTLAIFGLPEIDPGLNRLYARSLDYLQVLVLDGTTHAILASVDVPCRQRLTIDIVRHRLYGIGYATNGICMSVIDGMTNSVTESFWLPFVHSGDLFDVAVNSSNGHVAIVSGSYADIVTLVDPETRADLGEFYTYTSYQDAIVFNPATGKIFAASRNSGTPFADSGGLVYVASLATGP